MMEFSIIFLIVCLLVFLTNNPAYRKFRYKWRWLIVSVGFPAFFFFVVYPDFNWMKFILFCVMILATIMEFRKYGQTLSMQE